MLPPYTKPYLSFPDQVELLKNRGLTVTNDALAAHFLERIGYYRLKDYWFPFRQTQQVVDGAGNSRTEVLEDFRPGTEFQHAVELYVFDKKLRMLLTDAVERIEVALRVDVAHILGKRDRLAHRACQHLDPKLASAPRNGSTRHAFWLIRADEAEARSRADWVQEFRRHHSPPMPVWMSVETWDFGTLSHLLEIIHPVDRLAVATKYGIRNTKLLASWIKTLSNVRNICAHHGRLWNHPLVNQPMVPKKADMPTMSHLGTYNFTQTRVYAAAAICQHFLSIINPNSSWKSRLMALWNDFPPIPGINPIQAGFMPAWRTWPLWR